MQIYVKLFARCHHAPTKTLQMTFRQNNGSWTVVYSRLVRVEATATAHAQQLCFCWSAQNLLEGAHVEFCMPAEPPKIFQE